MASSPLDQVEIQQDSQVYTKNRSSGTLNEKPAFVKWFSWVLVDSVTTTKGIATGMSTVLLTREIKTHSALSN